MKVADKESPGVKILSLFDGMACGMIAMQLAWEVNNNNG